MQEECVLFLLCGFRCTSATLLIGTLGLNERLLLFSLSLSAVHTTLKKCGACLSAIDVFVALSVAASLGVGTLIKMCFTKYASAFSRSLFGDPKIGRVVVVDDGRR